MVKTRKIKVKTIITKIIITIMMRMRIKQGLLYVVNRGYVMWCRQGLLYVVAVFVCFVVVFMCVCVFF